MDWGHGNRQTQGRSRWPPLRIKYSTSVRKNVCRIRKNLWTKWAKRDFRIEIRPVGHTLIFVFRRADAVNWVEVPWARVCKCLGNCQIPKMLQQQELQRYSFFFIFHKGLGLLYAISLRLSVLLFHRLCFSLASSFSIVHYDPSASAVASLTVRFQFQLTDFQHRFSRERTL